ncbi:MAG: ABC transporter substrate-binding protein [Dehalococcoidia bacterium]|nr:ABC transporter substrate-binding protein [Dehalococcoidia bacterium]
MQKKLGLLGAIPVLLMALLMACSPAATPSPAATAAPKAAATTAPVATAAPATTPAVQATAAPAASKPAASGPIKIGFLTPLVGVYAQLGADMRDGFLLYLDQKGNTLAGRKVEVTVEDDEVKPDVGLTKAKKLIEKDQVNILAGVVSSGVAAGIADYVVSQKVPLMLTNAGDDPLTQQKASPYIFRISFANSQTSMPLGEWAYKKGYRKAVLVASDYPAGWHHTGGFARTFTQAGGQIIQEVYYPLGTADMAPFTTSIKKDADVVHTFSAGADGLNFVKSYSEYGLKGKIPLIGNWTTTEDMIEKEGDAALGVVNGYPYVPTLDRPQNKAFVDAYTKKYNKPVPPQAEFGYAGAMAIDAALQAVNGNVEDVDGFIKALEKVQIEAPRGPVKFDKYHNVVQNIYITEVKRVDGKLVNSVVETAPNVSQFWTWSPEEYLKLTQYAELKGKWVK